MSLQAEGSMLNTTFDIKIRYDVMVISPYFRLSSLTMTLICDAGFLLPENGGRKAHTLFEEVAF